jgi:hypothetical protein
VQVRYSVTFEFDTQPPTTHRGTVAASQVGTCVARAVKEARKALRPRNWSSVVCVLLERVEQEAGDGAGPETPRAAAADAG